MPLHPPYASQVLGLKSCSTKPSNLRCLAFFWLKITRVIFLPDITYSWSPICFHSWIIKHRHIIMFLFISSAVPEHPTVCCLSSPSDHRACSDSPGHAFPLGKCLNAGPLALYLFSIIRIHPWLSKLFVVLQRMSNILRCLCLPLSLSLSLPTPTSCFYETGSLYYVVMAVLELTI